MNLDNLSKEFIDFVKKSPTSYNAVDNIKKILLNHGFAQLTENSNYNLKKGNNYFVVRNDSSIIAFKIGRNIELPGFKIIASHSDSPMFKLKSNSISKVNESTLLNVECYGGAILSSFFDRPLSIAGRIIYCENDKIKAKIVNSNQPLCLVPNLCIHFNRDINQGHSYDLEREIKPLFTLNQEFSSFYDFLQKTYEISGKIQNYDLFVYNYEKGIIWGKDGEFISSPRIDDLGCVYLSLQALLSSNNEDEISLMCVFDNEEVGSASIQGAYSDFLRTTLMRIAHALSYNDDQFSQMIRKSFLVSSDNGHAEHPNYLNTIDPNNKVLLKHGVMIKYNSSLAYTSDGLSSSVLMKIFDNNNVSYQHFHNNNNIRGGSTLGNLSLREISILSVDIGLPQLAMHSSYETVAKDDLLMLYKGMKAIYQSKIDIENNEYIVR